jgi:3'(2'), 5'-bisphosphate nucleotidase
MAVNNLDKLLNVTGTIAEEAGKLIMEIYNTEFKVNIKEDKSPLTEADMAAHHHIESSLAKLSAYPTLSEESKAIPFSERQQWETYWLVDPLDGTKEFIKRNGDFTVNIALIHQNKPVLGVVYVPVSQTLYYAAEGVGAFKQISGEPAQTIKVRDKTPEKLMVAGSSSHATPELENYLNNLPEHELKSIGSSLKLCLVAEGVADIYPRIGLTSEWDTGAAQCIVEQAGGQVTDLGGRQLLYNTKDSYLNPFFLVFGDSTTDWTEFAKAKA